MRGSLSPLMEAILSLVVQLHSLKLTPENRPLEKEIPIGNHNFWGAKYRYASFREGNQPILKKKGQLKSSWESIFPFNRKVDNSEHLQQPS